MDAFGMTDKGRRRESNEDRALVNRETGLCVITDGMGGHVLGEVASEKAVIGIDDYVSLALRKALNEPENITRASDRAGRGENLALPECFSQERYRSVSPGNEGRLKKLVEEAILNAHREIYEYSQSLAKDNIMGTTASLVLFQDGMAYVAHVGDSRTYLFRKGSHLKLTKDHTCAQELVDLGLLDESAAENHESSHRLTRALGAGAYVVPDVMSIPCEPGDVFLLSSDGLFRVLGIEEVARIMAGHGSAQEKCGQLIKKSLEGGAPDNVSVIVVQLRGGGA